jgi:hypothetical protein
VRPSLNERAAYELLTHPRDSPFPSFSHFLLYEWRISPRSVDVVAIEKGDRSVRTAVHIDGQQHRTPTARAADSKFDVELLSLHGFTRTVRLQQDQTHSWGHILTAACT